MKSSGEHVSTRPNEQATYPLPSKRHFGNKLVSFRTEPLKRSGNEEETHRRTGCFTFAGRTGGIAHNQAKLSFGKPWQGEPPAGVLLCSASQKGKLFSKVLASGASLKLTRIPYARFNLIRPFRKKFSKNANPRYENSIESCVLLSSSRLLGHQPGTSRPH